MSLLHGTPSRRSVIRSLAAGSILLPGIIQGVLADDSRGGVNPLAPRAPHFPGRAKRVIFMYMSGGVSHMDTFDPKPKLLEAAMKPRAPGARPLMRPLWDFKPNPRCGTEVSELFPHVREIMDDVCLIRSMRGDHNDHFQATLGIHTGSVTFARPSIGSWVRDRKSTRLNSSHGYISYAVFCLKKKNTRHEEMHSA